MDSECHDMQQGRLIWAFLARYPQLIDIMTVPTPPCQDMGSSFDFWIPGVNPPKTSNRFPLTVFAPATLLQISSGQKDFYVLLCSASD